MEQNYVWSRIATLFAMETYSSYVAAASVACDVWMPQLRLRFFFCVSLMTPRVPSGRVLGRPCSTARLEYADAAATVHVCPRLH